MLLKLVQGVVVGIQRGRTFTKNATCFNLLFDERQKVENEWKKVENEWKRKKQPKQVEWNDDEDEQRRVFHEEERKKIVPNSKKQKFRCEITRQTKHESDCECNGMCLAKKSETYLIHYEGGIGIIPQK